MPADKADFPTFNKPVPACVAAWVSFCSGVVADCKLIANCCPAWDIAALDPARFPEFGAILETTLLAAIFPKVPDGASLLTTAVACCLPMSKASVAVLP